MIRRALVVLLLIAAAFGAYAAWAVLRAGGDRAGEVFVDIRRGAGAFEMAGELERAGVLPSAWPFLVVRLTRPGSVLQAGEYRFQLPLSPLEAYDKIARGDIFYHSLTIPEGYTMWEIADAVAATGLMERDAFLDAARRGERVADLAPGAETLEGFLFPDTYRLTRHATADELVGQMLRRFAEMARELPRAENLREAVILASLVEKETAVAAERRLVASVFRNRLRIGMALQCDPTVVYALHLAGRYRGEIYKDDLAFQSPYNTYAHPGLPPGPIANPGRASLAAALEPAATDYLYFVADNRGGHIFSADLDRHSRAVAGYRNPRRNAPRKAAPQHGRRR